jgi:hypothetical protein
LFRYCSVTSIVSWSWLCPILFCKYHHTWNCYEILFFARQTFFICMNFSAPSHTLPLLPWCWWLVELFIPLSTCFSLFSVQWAELVKQMLPHI